MGKKERKEGWREEGRTKRRDMLLFKSTNQKVHILLLLTYHWPELRQMATRSSKEN